MKICFDNVNFSARTGPNTFAKRLAASFYSRGIEIVDHSSLYDIMLTFIEPTQQHRVGSKLVQRLDGIWFKPEQFQSMNKKIKKCYEYADHIIWQSNFDKKMTTHHWGNPKSGSVINNGIDLIPIKEIKIPALIELKKTYDKIFVCSSNWHPQKRLKDNINLFYHLKQNFYPNSGLIVMGSDPDFAATTDVHYTGSQSSDVYMQVFTMSDWMIHLAWLDHCPNVVAESLSQNTPVICTDQGGTKELVKDFGVVLHENSYKFELVDYDNPPEVNVKQIVKPLPDKSELGSHAEIDIQLIAERYENVFKGIL